MPEFTAFVQQRRYIQWYKKAIISISPDCVVLNHSSKHKWKESITTLNSSQYELISSIARIRFATRADYDHAVSLLFSTSSAISCEL